MVFDSYSDLIYGRRADPEVCAHAAHVQLFGRTASRCMHTRTAGPLQAERRIVRHLPQAAQRLRGVAVACGPSARLVYIGMDHFALPNDASPCQAHAFCTATSRQAPSGCYRRSGVSAIGHVGASYSQKRQDADEYRIPGPDGSGGAGACAARTTVRRAVLMARLTGRVVSIVERAWLLTPQFFRAGTVSCAS